MVGTAIYNSFFHSLTKLPGSFLARISSLPSFYHACKGDRHIWLWQQNQIYCDPNEAMFSSPGANNDFHNMKTNAKSPKLYDIWMRNEHDVGTLSCTDVVMYAKKRRILSLAFTDQSMKAPGTFMARHIDCWNELLLADRVEGSEWSTPRDMLVCAEYLLFDVFGGLCFGKDFQTKEPGENLLKESLYYTVS
ncbi:hypothetical protein K469DRAFT_586957 [Zopfia rhizophila CBS 207.26]|uniref:Uncharacterized protein n=1 Tax=Zopfia rhizophila CBS 207.26 TaxID=1314779 RepID=A0A6A6DTL6_9PEZI|nr:hypothetical protein K469DRAFT_586957 [Zopfia rhizophila CBS 207.26]